MVNLIELVMLIGDNKIEALRGLPHSIYDQAFHALPSGVLEDTYKVFQMQG